MIADFRSGPCLQGAPQPPKNVDGLAIMGPPGNLDAFDEPGPRLPPLDTPFKENRFTIDHQRRHSCLGSCGGDIS